MLLVFSSYSTIATTPTTFTTSIERNLMWSAEKAPNQQRQQNAQEWLDRAIKDVESEKMEIVFQSQWESKHWEAVKQNQTRKYRLCINELEALILKHMFELTTMNMSGTGE